MFIFSSICASVRKETFKSGLHTLHFKKPDD